MTQANYTPVQAANMDELHSSDRPLVVLIKQLVAQAMGIDPDDSDVNPLPEVTIQAGSDWLLVNLVKADEAAYVFTSQLFVTGTHMAYHFNYSDADATDHGSEIGTDALEDIALSAIEVSPKVSRFIDDLLSSPAVTPQAYHMVATWSMSHLFPTA